MGTLDLCKEICPICKTQCVWKVNAHTELKVDHRCQYNDSWPLK